MRVGEDMREILFRGKRLDNGEWVYGNLAIRIDGETTILGIIPILPMLMKMIFAVTESRR